MKEFFINLWKSIKENLFRVDLLVHLLVCYAIVTMLTTVIMVMGLPKTGALVIAVIVAIIASALKEFWWDKKKGKGTFEIWDLLFDYFGIIAGIAVVLLL